MNQRSQDTALQKAVSGLKLRDIVLYAARFSRPTKPSNEGVIEAALQTKRVVKFTRELVTDDDQPKKIVNVVIELGTRVVSESSPAIYIEIEADYLASYELSSDLDEEAIKAFADYNAVHNVWPFWRQHVYDIVQRGRLPHMDVPLFAGSSQAATRKRPKSRATSGRPTAQVSRHRV